MTVRLSYIFFIRPVIKMRIRYFNVLLHCHASAISGSYINYNSYLEDKRFILLQHTTRIFEISKQLKVSSQCLIFSSDRGLHKNLMDLIFKSLPKFRVGDSPTFTMES